MRRVPAARHRGVRLVGSLVEIDHWRRPQLVWAASLVTEAK